MPQQDLIFELLKNDLTAPRMMLDQVANYIRDYYGYESANIDRFFAEKFPQMEDYEVDLTFSPQYTPAEHNRLEYIPVLGENALLPEEVDALKRRLREANLTTSLKTVDERKEIQIPVHEMFIERYVNLLRLDQKLPAGIYAELITNVPEASRNEANLLAREEAWASKSHQDILLAFLHVFKAQNNFTVPKLTYLTNFVRTYRPASLLDMERQFVAMIESCKHDMENIAGRGFADETLKNEYIITAGDNKGHSDDNVWHHYQQLMEMAQELQEDFQAICRLAPEFIERAGNQQPV